MQTLDISLSDIDIEKSINVRTDVNTANFKDSLGELAASIQENGLLQPIVLRGEYGKPPYDVVVGQRRFMACQQLGKTTIKAMFTGKITDNEAIVLSLSENLLRREMNQMDIATAVTRIYEQLDKDERRVQKRLGLSLQAIRGYIKVEAQATPKIKSLIKTGKLSMIDARRAIIAAQGNSAKAEQFVESLSQMTRHEKIRVVEFGRTNPTATAAEIVKKGQTQKIEETVILSLPQKVSKALKEASERLNRDSEEIIMSALTEWLTTNNYMLSSLV